MIEAQRVAGKPYKPRAFRKIFSMPDAHVFTSIVQYQYVARLTSILRKGDLQVYRIALLPLNLINNLKGTGKDILEPSNAYKLKCDVQISSN